MTDAEFNAAIERMIQGDRSGLRDVYDAYGNTIYRLFLGRVHRHQDAEDLTSEFFLKLWGCASTYRTGTGHKCWMNTIARNMAVDFQRKNREIPMEDTAQTYEQQQITAETTEDTVIGTMHTAQILSKLSEDEREIVQMHLSAELTFREIAAILKRPLGTVAWKYRTAIGKLQKLAEEGQLV
ncbi:MAG: RNA polymerase sigma factor [Oscillospiraceae bacterium]|nr:RNA polymerase sigma factor [Oscillospiraceae bacterium]